METQTDYTLTLLLTATPAEVFEAITDVRGWWSENITGETDTKGAIFNYSFKDVHRCKIEVTELIPNQKVVWQVLENHFNFTKDPKEWVGNHIIFKIETTEEGTRLTFTHLGLIPEYECYQICHDCWTDYLQNSFTQLLSTGKGSPNPKEE